MGSVSVGVVGIRTSLSAAMLLIIPYKTAYKTTSRPNSRRSRPHDTSRGRTYTPRNGKRLHIRRLQHIRVRPSSGILHFCGTNVIGVKVPVKVGQVLFAFSPYTEPKDKREQGDTNNAADNGTYYCSCVGRSGIVVVVVVVIVVVGR